MKRARLAVLTLLCLAVSLGAQPPQEPAEGDHPATPRLEAPEQHPELMQQAHAEAVDPHAKFKESPSVQWLARLTGLPLKWAFWAAVIFNFAIVAAVVGYLGRKYVPGIFRRRTEGIQREMREAEKASAEANRRLSDIEARLARLDGEIAEMRAAAEKEAAAEEERIRAAAEQDKERIVTAAQQEIAMAARLARRELQAHAAELAVSLAAKRIRIDAATDQALVRHFTGQLKGSEDNGAPGAAGDGGEKA